MSHRGRGTFPYRGRGNSSYRGRGSGNRVIAQYGSQKLIAEKISNTESSSSSNNLNDDPLMKEFLEYKAKQGYTKHSDDNNPSYAKVVDEENNDDQLYKQNLYKEIIFLLEDRDLKWKDDVWHIMSRYLDTASYTAGSYKQRRHYENILKVTDSCEITHFHSGSNKEIYSFSKCIIKQIISAEEWGISTLKEREYNLSNNKNQLNQLIKYNYWDYIEAFNKAFFYENQTKTHTWFFKFCPKVYNKDIPNWLYQWWTNYGPSAKILPEKYEDLYFEWMDISPALIEAQHDNKWIEGMTSSHFFIEFGIPWIWKWEPEIGYTQGNIPCLNRIFFSKFWKKMLLVNNQGKIEGQTTIDLIKEKISQYKEQIQLKKQREYPSPFQHISRKINIQKGQMSKAEFIATYVEEIKKDILKNFEKDHRSDTSMAAASNEEGSLLEDNEDYFLPGESQDVEIEEEDINNIFKKIEDEFEEHIKDSKKDKGKNKMEN